MKRSDDIQPHLTVEERTELRRGARKEVPRSAHAAWEPAGDRRDPVDLLEEQAATRVPETLARAHARAGDSVAIGAYLGRSETFDRALAGFAEAYADQNERDYATVVEAVASGRITAEPDTR